MFVLVFSKNFLFKTIEVENVFKNLKRYLRLRSLWFQNYSTYPKNYKGSFFWNMRKYQASKNDSPKKKISYESYFISDIEVRLKWLKFELHFLSFLISCPSFVCCCTLYCILHIIDEETGSVHSFFRGALDVDVLEIPWESDINKIVDVQTNRLDWQTNINPPEGGKNLFCG